MSSVVMSSVQIAVFGLVLASVAVLLIGLWENSHKWRLGIFDGLRAMLERVAVWWILRVVSPLAGVGFDLARRVGGRFWPRHAYAVAKFVQMSLVPNVLLHFLAWPFAYDVLSAKLKAEQNGGQR